MCGFKPGDEVVCIAEADGYPYTGRRYVVSHTLPPLSSSLYGVRLTTDTEDLFPSERVGWAHTMFRKVARKSDSLSIEAFLTIKPNQFEGPTRTNQPAKRKEQA